MSENKNDQRSSISNARSPAEIGEYWDSHSLADHWDQTHEVEFEIRAPHRITLDPEIYARLEELAKSRGVSLATLANSWLKEKLSGDKAA
jgi:aryl-alcohol dehydrogenase-like predicted oxidoreductase